MTHPATQGGNIGAQLRVIVERIEKLAQEKKAIGDDISEVYREAKSEGLDIKTIRKVVAIRKLDAAEREEQEHLRDVYLHALGLLDAIGE